MGFFFCGSHFTTPSGHQLAEVTTFYVKSEAFMYKQNPSQFAAPLDVVSCKDMQQNLYCQLLCGLMKSSRVVMMASSLIKVIRGAMGFLKENWEELCQDIETGTLSARITDAAARQAVSSVLSGPDPELAYHIRRECCKESWAGILIRLWPRLAAILSICTGALLQDVEHFEFLSGNKVQFMSPAISSSEGIMAFNPHLDTHPKNVTYIFVPEAGFFEFRRLRDSSLIELADVCEGEDEYEIIFTNLSGLWRYRMGDIVKCVGYYHSSPKFQFVWRYNLVINVAHEVVYEYEITQAVESAARLCLSPYARLVDYTTTINKKEIIGHYVVFWELEIQLNTAKELEFSETLPNRFDESLRQCCLAIENALNDKYRKERMVGVIAPLELILVKPGTFSQLYKEGQAEGRTQLKQPRTYKPEHESVQILYSAAHKSFRSATLPRSPSE